MMRRFLILSACLTGLSLFLVPGHTLVHAQSVDYGGYRPQYPPIGAYDATGGRGGDIYFVDTQAWDTGAATRCTGNCGGLATSAVCSTVTCYRGSLKACLAGSGARYCLPTVSGYIDMPFVGDDTYQIPKGNLTIAMQTAPSPGITLRYSGLAIGVSNVVAQHLRIRVGSGPSGPCGGALWVNALTESTPDKVVIDHASVSWAMDENLGLGDNNNGSVMVWRTNASEPLSYHFAAQAPNCPQVKFFEGGPGHCFSMAGPRDTSHYYFIGESVVSNCPPDGRMLWGYSVYIQPTLVNNLIHGFSHFNTVTSANLASSSRAFKTTAVGNRFIANGTTCASQGHKFEFGNKVQGNQAYLADNSLSVPGGCAFPPGEHYIIRNGESGCSGECLSYNPIVASPPIGAPMPGGGWTARPSNAALETFVLANVGARPLDRDSADKRIINEIAARVPRAGVQDQNEVGGWPVLANNTRPLAIPANPHAIAPGQTFRTNIEVWLETLAGDLEGVPPAFRTPQGLRLDRSGE